jgi:hypothetical protein
VKTNPCRKATAAASVQLILSCRAVSNNQLAPVTANQLAEPTHGSVKVARNDLALICATCFSSWILGFDDDRWSPNTTSRRMVASDGTCPESISCLFRWPVSPHGPLDYRRAVEFGTYNPRDGGRPEIVTLDNDPDAAFHHCVVIGHRDKARYCLVDLGNSGKHTFISIRASQNRQHSLCWRSQFPSSSA